MNPDNIRDVCAWLTLQGLQGADEMDVVNGFCQRVREAGLQLDHCVVLIDTLHPVYEGRAFPWNSAEKDGAAVDYGSTSDASVFAETWERSSFRYLLSSGDNEVRRRIGFGDPADFYNLDTLQAAGHTDYIAMIHRFSKDKQFGDMECLYSNWSTMDADGFREFDLEALRQMVPSLALAVKASSLSRISRTIAEVYLGEDAAKQVLEGRISRGRTERISAVLWFSDLQNYTRISDSLPPEEIIPFLNDYADAVISSVHEAGGTILKLVGDGTLAIFKAEAGTDACRQALLAEQALRERINVLNTRRMLENRAVTDVCLGLHIGEVFYGNIGSDNRLDFTVIGPAVNEVSRIVSMCRSVDRTVIMSSEFADAVTPLGSDEVVSLGRYALRGVKRVQELYTLARIGEIVD